MAHEFLKEVFALYKSLPALWSKDDQKFYGKHAKDVALMQLVDKYRELSPDATRTTVRKELVTFHAIMRKEEARKKEADRLGLPFESEHWFYDHLSFLIAKRKSRATSDVMVAMPRNGPVLSLQNNLKPSLAVLLQRKKLMTAHRRSELRPRQVFEEALRSKKHQKDELHLLTERLRSLPSEQRSHVVSIIHNILQLIEIDYQAETRRPMAVDTVKATHSSELGSQTPREHNINTGNAQTPLSKNMVTSVNMPERTPPQHATGSLGALHSSPNEAQGISFVDQIRYARPNLHPSSFQGQFPNRDTQ